MLKPEDIRNMRLKPAELDAHHGIGCPAFMTSPAACDMHVIGEAALGSVFGLSPEDFARGHQAARQYNASCLLKTGDRVVAVSALVSRVKGMEVVRRNVIAPKARLETREGWPPHVVIAMFVRADIESDPARLPVSIAGWLETREFEARKALTLPPGLSSNIAVVVVPCVNLRPLSELPKFLKGES